jgi:cytochrome c oxidase assembly factor CtaG
VYFTPIFDILVRRHWGHELMSVHFLLVGYLFFWAIVGIDPGPRRLPHLGRIGLLFAVMPFHAFFGIATMTMASTIGGQFYRYVDLPWLSSIESDQHLGGAIAWGSSELPVILVVIALIAQWHARIGGWCRAPTDTRMQTTATTNSTPTTRCCAGWRSFMVNSRASQPSMGKRS